MSEVKVIVRMNTSAEEAPGGPCVSATSWSEKRAMRETAHRNAMHSPRPQRIPKATPLKKKSSTPPPVTRPDSPNPDTMMRIDPKLVVVKAPKLVPASPTVIRADSPVMPRLKLPPPNKPKHSICGCVMD